MPNITHFRRVAAVTALAAGALAVALHAQQDFHWRARTADRGFLRGASSGSRCSRPRARSFRPRPPIASLMRTYPATGVVTGPYRSAG
jgi:hypothetical protein